MSDDQHDAIRRLFEGALSSGNKIAKEAIDFQDAAHGVAGQLISLLVSEPDAIHRIHSTPALAVCPLYDKLTLGGLKDRAGNTVTLCQDDQELILLAIFYTMVSSQAYCAAASTAEYIYNSTTSKMVKAARIEQAYRLLDHSHLKSAARRVAERMSDLATKWAKKAMTMTPGATD